MLDCEKLSQVIISKYPNIRFDIAYTEFYIMHMTKK